MDPMLPPRTPPRPENGYRDDPKPEKKPRPARTTCHPNQARRTLNVEGFVTCDATTLELTMRLNEKIHLAEVAQGIANKAQRQADAAQAEAAAAQNALAIRVEQVRAATTHVAEAGAPLLDP